MAGRQYLKKNLDLRRRSGSRPVSNPAPPQTNRTRFKHSSSERRRQPLPDARSRPAPAHARPSEQVKRAAKEQHLSEVMKELEKVKKERSLLQRRLQFAEDRASGNYPADTAADSSVVRSRFNSGDTDGSEGHSVDYAATTSVSRTFSESWKGQGSSGGNMASQFRPENSMSSDTNPLDDNKGYETRFMTSDNATVLVLSSQVRNLIQYLQRAPSTAQKYTRVRQLIQGCNDPAPPSSEKLWARLEYLTKMILSRPPGSAESHE